MVQRGIVSLLAGQRFEKEGFIMYTQLGIRQGATNRGGPLFQRNKPTVSKPWDPANRITFESTGRLKAPQRNHRTIWCGGVSKLTDTEPPLNCKIIKNTHTAFVPTQTGIFYYQTSSRAKLNALTLYTSKSLNVKRNAISTPTSMLQSRTMPSAQQDEPSTGQER